MNCAKAGHDWQMYGGRQCPRNENARASQTVYQCARCGAYDYGDPGGPGHRDCVVEGPCHRSCLIPKKERKQLRKDLARQERERRKRELYVAFYAMNDNPSWKCKDGREMKISDMETSHVRNSINMILRGHDVAGAKVGKKTTAKLARLQLELGFRESMNERFNLDEEQIRIRRNQKRAAMQQWERISE